MTPIKYEVLCPIHGIQQPTVNYPHKSVAVGAPRNKRERNTMGCPSCRAEKRAANEAKTK